MSNSKEGSQDAAVGSEGAISTPPLFAPPPSQQLNVNDRIPMTSASSGHALLNHGASASHRGPTREWLAATAHLPPGSPDSAFFAVAASLEAQERARGEADEAAAVAARRQQQRAAQQQREAEEAQQRADEDELLAIGMQVLRCTRCDATVQRSEPWAKMANGEIRCALCAVGTAEGRQQVRSAPNVRREVYAQLAREQSSQQLTATQLSAAAAASSSSSSSAAAAASHNSRPQLFVCGWCEAPTPSRDAFPQLDGSVLCRGCEVTRCTSRNHEQDFFATRARACWNGGNNGGNNGGDDSGELMPLFALPRHDAMRRERQEEQATSSSPVARAVADDNAARIHALETELAAARAAAARRNNDDAYRAFDAAVEAMHVVAFSFDTIRGGRDWVDCDGSCGGTFSCLHTEKRHLLFPTGSAEQVAAACDRATTWAFRHSPPPTCVNPSCRKQCDVRTAECAKKGAHMCWRCDCGRQNRISRGGTWREGRQSEIGEALRVLFAIMVGDSASRIAALKTASRGDGSERDHETRRRSVIDVLADAGRCCSVFNELESMLKTEQVNKGNVDETVMCTVGGKPLWAAGGVAIRGNFCSWLTVRLIQPEIVIGDLGELDEVALARSAEVMLPITNHLWAGSATFLADGLAVYHRVGIRNGVNHYRFIHSLKNYGGAGGEHSNYIESSWSWLKRWLLTRVGGAQVLRRVDGDDLLQLAVFAFNRAADARLQQRFALAPEWQHAVNPLSALAKLLIDVGAAARTDIAAGLPPLQLARQQHLPPAVAVLPRFLQLCWRARVTYARWREAEAAFFGNPENEALIARVMAERTAKFSEATAAAHERFKRLSHSATARVKLGLQRDDDDNNNNAAAAAAAADGNNNNQQRGADGKFLPRNDGQPSRRQQAALQQQAAGNNNSDNNDGAAAAVAMTPEQARRVANRKLAQTKSSRNKARGSDVAMLREQLAAQSANVEALTALVRSLMPPQQQPQQAASAAAAAPAAARVAFAPPPPPARAPSASPSSSSSSSDDVSSGDGSDTSSDDDDDSCPRELRHTCAECGRDEANHRAGSTAVQCAGCRRWAFSAKCHGLPAKFFRAEVTADWFCSGCSNNGGK